MQTVNPITKAIEESDKRSLDMFRPRNQITGENCYGHTKKLVLNGYSLRTQWLTPEVAENPLYKMAFKAKSLSKLTETFNKKYGTNYEQEDIGHTLFVLRVQRDPWFALGSVYYIKSKETGKMVPFRLRYAQHVLLTEMEKMRLAGVPIRLILLKARQWGGSTLVQLYMSWIQLFIKEGWNSVIVAQTKATARRIKGMYHKVLENLPASVLFEVPEINFSPYEHNNDDFIVTYKHQPVRDNVITIASYENFESTRGADFAMAHFSETAYWTPTPTKCAEDVITNIQGNMLVAPYTIEVTESTANGMSGMFYNEYKLAKGGKSSRVALFIPFFYLEHDRLMFKSRKEKHEFAAWLYENKDEQETDVETREPGAYLWSLLEKGATLEHVKWYIQKRSSFHSHAQMASEAPADDVECFKFSGHLVLDMYTIDLLRERYVKAPAYVGMMHAGKFIEEANGKFFIWKHPDTRVRSRNRYLVIVDVGGRSAKADYSVITVIDRWATRFKGGKLEVVARWRGHLRYDMMARLAVEIARYYCDAKLVFESNTFDLRKAQAGDDSWSDGDHIEGILNTIGRDYKNLYMREATSPEDIKQGIVKKIGFQTNAKTKQAMVDNFIVMFTDDEFIDHDERFYAEAGIYEQTPDGKYQNIQGRDNHDDIIMTDMIGCLVHLKMPAPEIVREDEYVSIGMDTGTNNESKL